MFSLDIVDSDAFLDMSKEAQCLYFHMAMRADDDGFIDNSKKIMRMIGASEDTLKILFAKRFVIGFENGIVVIKHWKIHNYIAKDRYHATKYLDQKKAIIIKENGAYTEGAQDVYNMYTQTRLDKTRLDKIRQDKKRETNVSPISKEFNLIWNNEIKKIKKSRAKTLYQRLRKKYSFEDIQKMREKHQNKWKEQGKEQYITSLANWILNEGWEDDNNYISESDNEKLRNEYILVYKEKMPINWEQPENWAEIVKKEWERT